MRTLRLFSATGLLALFTGAATLLAQHGRPIDVEASARGAARVIVGQVIRVDPVQQTSAFGDLLIVSHTMVRIDEVLKGAAGTTIGVEIEGGTLNGVTMRASDMPALQVGDRAVFFVDARPAGAFVPHQRGHGVLKLDARGNADNGTLSLDAIRASVQAAAR